MSIQSSLNQGITGTMLLLSQTPWAEGRRTERKLAVEQKERLGRAQQCADEAEAIHTERLSALEEEKKAVDEARRNLESSGPVGIVGGRAVGRAQIRERQELLRGEETKIHEEYAESLKGLPGQGERYAQAEMIASRSRGNLQGRMSVEEARRQRLEATMGRLKERQETEETSRELRERLGGTGYGK